MDSILIVININLSDTHQMVGCHGFCNHFPDITMCSFQVHTGDSTKLFVWIGTAIQSFVQITDGIDAVAIHAFIVPEADNIKDFFFCLRIVPVEIRLFFCEEMQIILSTLRYIFPGTAAKHRHPAIRCTTIRSRISPDIIITVGVVAGFSGFLKPDMSVRRVIQHQIHDNCNPPRMSPVPESIPVLHGSEFFHDGGIIGNVISIIHIW